MAGTFKHYWVGTTLMVESDSGVSGADLKGDTGDIGPRGPQGPAGVVVDGSGNLNIDLTGYATETYVDNKLTNYATKTYVNQAVANAGGGGSGGSNGDTILFQKDDFTNEVLNEFVIWNGSYLTSNISINTIIPQATYYVSLTLTNGETDTFNFTIPTADATITISNSKYIDNVVVDYDGNDPQPYKLKFYQKASLTGTYYIQSMEIGMRNNYPASEIWTFELEDGSTVNKAVCVG